MNNTFQYAVGLYTADPNTSSPIVVVGLVTFVYFFSILDITIAWFLEREFRLEREHQLGGQVSTEPIADVGKFPSATPF